MQTIPEDLWRKGYKNQVCVDFSAVVVNNMSERHRPFRGIIWKHGDVRQLDDIPSGSVDVAFDKGTLDAMIHGSPWDPPDEVRDNTGRYVREVRMSRARNGPTRRVNFSLPSTDFSCCSRSFVCSNPMGGFST